MLDLLIEGEFVLISRKPEKFLKFLKIISIILPTHIIRKSKINNKVFKIYRKKIDKLRHVINNQTKYKRDYLVRKYLIDIINNLFDKNYVNSAQYTLLALEEWILSQETDKDFEAALALFSTHAIDAGKRFRKKFPLPDVENAKKHKIAFTSYWTSNIGTEGIMALSKHLHDYDKKFIALKCYDSLDLASYQIICEENNVKLVLPKEKVIYDVFVYRNLFIENCIEVAFWIMPPMHMFFLFAFGLAKTQVWFSLYLRSNLNFQFLDGKITPGGSGFSKKKYFNGANWDILPQITYINGLPIADKSKRVVLFVPGRLEKLKQPDFFNTVLRIMRKAPETVIKWTGYYEDHEVKNMFAMYGLAKRNIYIPWQSMEGLYKEIKSADLILSPFPLALGTTEMMASVFYRPIISMYNEENSMYWRDCFWEAMQGDPVLKNICLDKNGDSILRINNSVDDYLDDALNVISDDELGKKYAQVYHDAYKYTYLSNPNDLEKTFSDFLNSILDKK